MREKVCLNGKWNFMPDYKGLMADELIKDIKWEDEEYVVPSSWRFVKNEVQVLQPYDMFGYPKEWNNALTGVIGKKIYVEDNSKRVFLTFNGIMQRSAIYINNKKLVESEEAFLPIEVEITDYVRRGELNTILVWCGEHRTAETTVGTKRLAPDGTWFAYLCRGIWQDVYLEYRNQVYVDNVFINTSVRENKIIINAGFNGNTDDCSVRIIIYDGDKVVKSYKKNTDNNLALFEENWLDPTLWSPEGPHLYNLVVELLKNEEVVDTYTERFGFREVWIENHKFILNGKRMNLRGDSWHYQGFVQQNKEYAVNWFKLCKQTGMNFVRLHAMPYPEFYLEAADEIGMLIIDESAIYGSCKSIAAAHPEFIENCNNHLTSLVLRDRNHPSIVIWSMQNEMRWVDGNDGYKVAMRGLVKRMKELDPTRPISFDGDNRLVDPKDMEIITMHYNIDGTIEDWDKSKPLFFGEHGKFHFIAPNISGNLTGSKVYYDYDSNMESIGLHQALFIERVRKEEVTGHSPFNIVNYCAKAMPNEDIIIRIEVEEGKPGVQPYVVRKYSLTLNNGMLSDYPMFIPNSAYNHLKKAFEPITIIADEYNTSFFGGREITRNFSVYNDTENDANAIIRYSLCNKDGTVFCKGSKEFHHVCGERIECTFDLAMPKVSQREKVSLVIELYHDAKLQHTLVKEYNVYPEIVPIQVKGVAYIGDEDGFSHINKVAVGINHISELTEQNLKEINFLIIGKNYSDSLIEIQSMLNDFVRNGGFVLVLEQDTQMLGDANLSGKKFFKAIPTQESHPVFDGLVEADLEYWTERNIHDSQCVNMVTNALEKPVNGNEKCLLECGEGDFGWGGLLWSAMLEYNIGKGGIILNQLELLDNLECVPQAGVILNNLLNYGISKSNNAYSNTALLCTSGSQTHKFFNEIGLTFDLIGIENIEDYNLVIIDPELAQKDIVPIKQYIKNGGKAVLLPTTIDEEKLVSLLFETRVDIKEATTYQLIAYEHKYTSGICAHDLCNFEKVTYSAMEKANVPSCLYSMDVPYSKLLLKNVKNPWELFFVNGYDGEYIKISAATYIENSKFEELNYCGVKQLGKGEIVYCQLLLADDYKSYRFYSQLLCNMGADVNTILLSYVKEKSDYGVPAFMTLATNEKKPFEDQLNYFSSENYLLNNLGEGVYGWMKRAEKENGLIRVNNSANKTFFLTSFIYSNTNRNPLKRVEGQIPDSSIVPDVFIDANCSFSLFVNGKCFANKQKPQVETMKIEDVMLDKGLNRICLVCYGGEKDIALNICFKNKYGDFINDLKYGLTLD